MRAPEPLHGPTRVQHRSESKSPLAGNGPGKAPAYEELMPSVVPRRLDVTSKGDLLLERERATEIAASGLLRLCAAGFVAYCSYAICRTPLLPLFARDPGFRSWRSWR